MRRFTTYVIALSVFCGAAVAAQKVTTPDELDKAMKKIAPAMGATNKAVQSMAYADAKMQIATVKQALVDAQNFWEANKKADAVEMGKTSIARVEAVEQALNAPTPDQQAVLGALKQVGGTCGACHMQYRVQDANMQYILKPGSI